MFTIPTIIKHHRAQLVTNQALSKLGEEQEVHPLGSSGFWLCAKCSLCYIYCSEQYRQFTSRCYYYESAGCVDKYHALVLYDNLFTTGTLLNSSPNERMDLSELGYVSHGMKNTPMKSEIQGQLFDDNMATLATSPLCNGIDNSNTHFAQSSGAWLWGWKWWGWLLFQHQWRRWQCGAQLWLCTC